MFFESLESLLDVLSEEIEIVSEIAWSFRSVGPLQVEVVNESYGYLKDEHTYTVAVEERDGIVVPGECECPADRYHEEYGCKHKGALATVGGTVGGTVVLNAARAFPLESEVRAKPVTTVAD